MHFKKSTGFTLIELMIVVIIIGILSSIALPTYQTYIQRARFAEVIAATSIYKTAVALALQQGMPMAALSTGSQEIPPQAKPTKNIASILVENGTITAVATELIANATYILKPNNDGSSWTIAGTCLKLGLCRS